MIIRICVFAFAMLLAATAAAQERYAPSSATPQGHEIIAVFVTSSTCIGSSQPHMPATIERMKLLLRAQAAESAEGLSIAGHSLDWMPKTGIEHLEKFGAFDEMLVGRNWFGVGAIHFIWRDVPGSPATPQVILLRREIKIGDTAVAVTPDQEVGRIVGADSIKAWVDAGAPVPVRVDPGAAETINNSKRMPDGKQWTTANLNLDIAGSVCYGGAALNCSRYGRLYTWESAKQVCQSLGGGWRLPTNDDWYQLAKHHGGIRGASAEAGKAAYQALLVGGSSGFNAVLGGGRAPDGVQYARLDAHGFYWTASETDSATAWFYNFGKGQLSLGRHDDGEKERALSARCISD